MDKLITYFVIVLVSIIAGAGAVAVAVLGHPILKHDVGYEGQNNTRIAPGQVVIDRTLGALAGPDIASPYLQWGGIPLYQTGAPLTTSTTTVCAIQSPVSTSTLNSAGIQLTTSTTTASTLWIAKAATAYATTTSLATTSIAANAPAFLSAFSTSTTVAADLRQFQTDLVFAPSSFIVFALSGGHGHFSPVGECHATFEDYL